MPAAPDSRHEVRVPEMGGLKTASVVEVVVKVGDSVSVDETLVILEGDKVAVEVPSPVVGVVKEILVKTGVSVGVGDPIMILTVEGGDAKSKPAATEAPASSDAGKSAAQASPAGKPNGQVKASPLVKKVARELGVDLAHVSGTGPAGRITEEDVRQHSAGKSEDSVAVSAPKVEVSSGQAGEFSEFGPVEVVPLTGIQKASGAHLHKSWVSMPSVTHIDEADVTELDVFRKGLDDVGKASDPRYRVSFLPFIIKALSAAFKPHPAIAASLSEDGASLIYKRYCHIGTAVDTPAGLLVPVIKDVDRKGVIEIAQEIASLSATALAGKLSRSDMKGGVFTVSSLGGIGGSSFTPIINAPEVAILGVTRAQVKPVWTGSEFTPRLMLTLCLSYDHRVVDGALAARFCRTLVTILEDMRLLVL